MDWDKLKIFHAVAEAGSFTNATINLNLSQSAISRQIQSLEQDLKVQLFERHARGLTLTENGEYVFKTAHEVISKLKEVETSLGDQKNKPTGKLTITTVRSFGTHWLTPRIQEFMTLNPEIEIELIFEDKELDLSTRQADIGIFMRRPKQLNYIQKKLIDLKYYIYGSNKYLEKFGMPKTINDLNKYLPALQTAEDLSLEIDHLKEGVFWSEGLKGLQKLPSNSIDLIVTEPPKEPWMNLESRGSQFTLQEYYSWNQKWIIEASRVLKNTGGIYLLCDWTYSNMNNGLLNEKFIVQNRITWHNRSAKTSKNNLTWKNQSGDIWFATKNEDFLFNNNATSLKSERHSLLSDREKKAQTNFWFDIPKVTNDNARYSNKLYSKILDASSFKLNWILDPFMRTGDVGVASKSSGRRFIGFEANKDKLLMSMKRIDQNNER